jgi:NADH dehydrogenase FAD-containing subunit
VTPEPLRVVIAGAGVGGLECALALADVAGARVAVTIADPHGCYAERASVIADALAGHSREDVSLEEVLHHTGATLLRNSVAAVAPADHLVTFDDGTTLMYDVLVAATGAASVPPGDGVLSIDPDRPQPLRRLADEVAEGSVARVGIIVPPGRHWTLPAYELALALAERARRGGQPVQILVAALEPQPLSILGSAGHQELLAALDQAGVRLAAGVAAEADPGPPPVVVLHSGGDAIEVEVDRLVALPVLQPRSIAGIGVGDEFLPVDADGRVAGCLDVYAIGDAVDEPLKLGSFAAQRAERTARVIARLSGAAAEPLAGPLVPRARLLTQPFAQNQRPAGKVAAPRLARRLAVLAAEGPPRALLQR